MAKEEKEQFYTGEGVDVTERIATGKTRFFKSLTLAQWWADLRKILQIRSFRRSDTWKTTVNRLRNPSII